jgi:hypothetical protein
MREVIPDNSQLEDLARRIYDETGEFYARVSPDMGSAALGYKILYGPAKRGVQVLFLGSQPGGGRDDAREGEILGERKGWPERFEYCTSSWDLARYARDIWRPDLLERSTAINANFFRSPSDDEWGKGKREGKNKIKVELRREIENFCECKAQKLVIAHDPQELIVIGVTLFDRLNNKRIPTKTHVYNELNGKFERLVVEGEVWGIPAKGVKHISGSRTTPYDRSKIREFFPKNSD